MADKIDISGDGGVLKEILKEGEGTETPLKVNIKAIFNLVTI